MKRQILGILTVSVTAPYLEAAILCAFIQGRLTSLSDLAWGIYFMGTVGLLKYGFTIVVVSLSAALTMKSLAVSAPAITISAYSFLGLCFGGHVLASFVQKQWWLLPSFGITGAICGWIYWRVVMGRPS
ncbi:hypothetical protein [Microvirga lotononidis]|uniref:Uncharacterized protein n=1 Tax=Microvirga lotononidis TaxID=864069 RepID=I4YMW8_9HYPH|nr:hypothetical protein [Microvirga lotononidis]EIM25310.1 hypothetical protein MicloDRAFT_00060350 [Microvirga lotononidis]WQO29214.1 hypothetical protein U0023_09175 [Microvirga lotononidis]